MVDETRRWLPLISSYQATSVKLRLKVSFTQELMLLTKCIQEQSWESWWAWWREHAVMYDLYQDALYEWEVKQGHGTYAERVQWAQAAKTSNE